MAVRASLIGDVAVYQVSGHRVTLPSGTSCVREYHMLKLTTCTAVEKQYKTQDRSVSETRTPIPVWSRTVLSTKTLLSSSTSSQMNNLLRLYGRFTQPGYLLPSKNQKSKTKEKKTRQVVRVLLVHFNGSDISILIHHLVLSHVIDLLPIGRIYDEARVSQNPYAYRLTAIT